MTATDWLASDDPIALTSFWRWKGELCQGCRNGGPGPAPSCRGVCRWPAPSPRKLRLVGCACCRLIWDRLPNDRARAAVETAERFAEGCADALALREAYGRTACLNASAAAQAGGPDLFHLIRRVVEVLTQHAQAQAVSAYGARRAALADAHRTSGPRRGAEMTVTERLDREMQMDFDRLAAEAKRGLAEAIKDLIGDPSRQAVLPAAWLDANGGQARLVAEGIHREGRFDELPVLADALEEGGCDDAAILAHARRPQHYRGCWLIDAVLGRA
jgi:hypothetical protein